MSANHYTTTSGPTTGSTYTSGTIPSTTHSTTTHSTTTGPTTVTPSTTHSTTTTTDANNHGQAAGEGVKGLFAKGHGIGESLRGNINSAIDGFTGDKASLAKNEQIAQGGEREFQTGQFAKRGTTDKAL